LESVHPLVDLTTKLFGTCHTVREFSGQLLGDEVDLKMF